MIRNYLPYFIYKRLFGDRRKYKTKIKRNDKDWKEWHKQIEKIYSLRETSLSGSLVNRFSYNILKKESLKNKTILEIGPGNFYHYIYWKNKPKKYIVADFNSKFLDISFSVLNRINVNSKKILIDKNNFKLKQKSESVDFVFSFFSLEHIYQLSDCIKEIRRILKKNGKLIFAIPNEGCFAWGFARYFISRRWIMKNTTINYDKIICWEHPNFASKIIKNLNEELKQVEIK